MSILLYIYIYIYIYIISYYNEHGTMILYDNYHIVSRKTLISKFGVESIIAFYEKKSETINIIDVCNCQNANIFFSFHLKRNP
jgi:hypothetical protein